MPHSPTTAFPRSTIHCILILVVFCILVHIPLIANPGFYNHDELQTYDIIQDLGFDGYCRLFFSIPDTPNFGVPVRPIGRVMVGFAMLALPNHPFLTHGFDVLTHAAVAVGLLLLLFRWRVAEKTAMTAASLFVICPTATLCVGWTGAMYDRLLALFILGTLFCAGEMLTRQRITWIIAFGLGCVAFAALAIGTKETALVLPAIVAGSLAFTRWQCKVSFSNLRALLVLMSVSLPILTYIGMRHEAIEASLFKKDKSSPYQVDVTRIPQSVLVYASYPFAYKAVESSVALRTANVAFALALHGLLLFGVTSRFGWKGLGYYGFAYYVILAPILPLNNTGAHYLYCCGLVIATSIALTMLSPGSSQKMRWAAAVICLVMVGQNLRIQHYLYDAGVLQHRLLVSLDSLLDGRSEEERGMVLVFTADRDFKEHVLRRAIFGRDTFGCLKGVEYCFESDPGDPPKENAILLECDNSGVIRRRHEVMTRHAQKKLSTMTQ